jgi:hypothetical protein
VLRVELTSLTVVATGDRLAPMPDPGVRQRLRDALMTAMRARDRVAVTVLRSTLAAIDNAESVDIAPSAGVHLAIELTPIGVGAAEVERRLLTEAQLEQIVRAEMAEREAAAIDYERSGRLEHAERLRTEIGVLSSHLPDLM